MIWRHRQDTTVGLPTTTVVQYSIYDGAVDYYRQERINAQQLGGVGGSGTTDIPETACATRCKCIASPDDGAPHTAA